MGKKAGTKKGGKSKKVERKKNALFEKREKNFRIGNDI